MGCFFCTAPLPHLLEKGGPLPPPLLVAACCKHAAPATPSDQCVAPSHPWGTMSPDFKQPLAWLRAAKNSCFQRARSLQWAATFFLRVREVSACMRSPSMPSASGTPALGACYPGGCWEESSAAQACVQPLLPPPPHKGPGSAPSSPRLQASSLSPGPETRALMGAFVG